MQIRRRALLQKVLTGIVTLVGGLLAGAVLVQSASAIGIHAHRGGPLVEGAAAYPENSMSAFRHSLAQGWVIELDLMRTQDGVAVVMHDSTLDRTTDCTGTVASWTSTALDSGCELDRLGIDSATEDLAPGDPRRERVPRLAEVLTLLKDTGGRANIEVKDLTNDFPKAVYQQIATSGVTPGQLILQNFAAPGLADVSTMLPGAGISMLALNGSPHYFGIAKTVKANWISPSWSDVDQPAQYVKDAHAQGLSVVPWTIDDEAGLLAAGAAGVDAVISNDPTRAQRLIGPEPAPKLALKARRLGSAGVRRGQSRTFVLTVANSGDAASGPLRLVVGFPRALLRLRGAAGRKVAAVPAGRSRTVRFTLRVRPLAGLGRKARVRFVAREAGPAPAAILRTALTLRTLPARKR